MILGMRKIGRMEGEKGEKYLSIHTSSWYTTNVLWILEANKIIGRNRVLKKKLGFKKP